MKKEEENDFSELIEYLDEKFQELATKDYVDEKFEKLATKDYVDEKFQELESKITPLPTKSYIDDKFSELSGDLIVKLRKEDQKVNRLLEILKRKNLLGESDLQELAQFKIFPKQE